MNVSLADIAAPILVTGATGFIGRRLVRRLLDEGHTPRALVLPKDAVPIEWGDRVHVVRGDVADPNAVGKACRGIKTVFHLAAVVSDWGDPKDHERVTVGGTQNVLRHAADAGARALLASSVAAYGQNASTMVCDEQTPLGRALGPYSHSKQEQERIALRLEAKRSLRVTIIRPTNVIGAGSVPWVDLAVEQLRAGMPTLIGGGRRTAALTHVDNVVDIFVRAAALPATVGRVYNASDGTDVTWLRYFTELAQLCGSKPPKSIPMWTAKLAARGMPAGHKLLRRKGRPALTPEALNLVGSSLRVPIARARTELGYAPLVSFQQAMREIADYLARR